MSIPPALIAIGLKTAQSRTPLFVCDTDWLGATREWHPPTATGERWIVVSEAATMLQVSRQRIGQLVAVGRLQAQRLGARGVLIDAESVATLERRRRARPALAGADSLPDGWILPVQAARLLRVTRQQVHHLIRSGRLESQQPSPRRVIVKRASVEAYAQDVRSHRRDPECVVVRTRAPRASRMFIDCRY